jgi:hypothetical protein
MVLFKIFYVSNVSTLTNKEESFFKDVQQASYKAYSQTSTGMTIDEWNNSAFLYTTRIEAETYLNRSVGTPSVIVMYRASDKDEFKAAYLKGIGAPAAWTTAFTNIFNLVPLEIREREGDKDPNGTNPNHNGNGRSDGAGGSGWFPFGTRECGLMDSILDGLGLTKGLKQLAYGGLALWTGSRALQSGNTTGQAVQGGAAAYFLYLALTDTDSGCNPKKKK